MTTASLLHTHCCRSPPPPGEHIRTTDERTNRRTDRQHHRLSPRICEERGLNSLDSKGNYSATSNKCHIGQVLRRHLRGHIANEFSHLGTSRLVNARSSLDLVVSHSLIDCTTHTTCRPNRRDSAFRVAAAAAASLWNSLSPKGTDRTLLAFNRHIKTAQQRTIIIYSNTLQ